MYYISIICTREVQFL